VPLAQVLNKMLATVKFDRHTSRHPCKTASLRITAVRVQSTPHLLTANADAACDLSGVLIDLLLCGQRRNRIRRALGPCARSTKQRLFSQRTPCSNVIRKERIQKPFRHDPPSHGLSSIQQAAADRPRAGVCRPSTGLVRRQSLRKYVLKLFQ